MADTNIKILLQAAGGAQVNAELARVTGSMDRVKSAGSEISRSLNLIAGAFGVTFGARAIGDVLRTADAYNQLQARIQAATRTTGDYAAVAEQLGTITRATGAALADTVSVFQGLARSAPELGATNSEMLRLTESVQKLGVISGASTAQLSNGLLQFSQAMAAGTVRAEEMNSILENLPEVAAAIAKGMGTTVGQLQRAVREGTVLSRDVFAALQSQAEDIDARFQEMPTTLQRGWNAMAQAFSGLIGQANELLGVTNAIGEAMSRIGRGMDRVSGALPAMERFLLLEQERARILQRLDGPVSGTQALGLRNRLAALQEEMRVLSDLNVEREKAAGLAEEETEWARAEAEAIEQAVAIQNEWVEATSALSKARTGGARAARSAATAEQTLAREVARTIAGLEEQAQKLTLGERGFLAYELAVKGASQAQIDYALSVYDQVEAMEAAQQGAQDTGREVDILATVVERAAESMTDALSDAFANIFRDGVRSFQKLADTLKNLFFDLLGDLLAASLANPIRIALGVGGTAAAGAASAASGGMNLLGGGSPLNLLSGISGVGSAFASGLGSLGVALTGGAPAGILGTLGNMGSFGMAGLTSGTLAGAAAGIGTLAAAAAPILLPLAIGAIAGNWFGDKTKPRAYFIARPDDTHPGFEDNVYAQSAFGLRFGLAQKSHDVDAREYEQVFQAMASLADMLAEVLGPDVASAVKERVRATEETRLIGPKSFDPGVGFQSIFNQILEFAAETGDQMSEILLALVGDVGRDLEAAAQKIAAAIQYVTGIQAFLDTPLQTTQTITLNEALGRSGERLRELVAGFDGSLQSQQAILAATQERYALEIAYLNAIQALALEIRASFEQTYESIRTAFFSPQEQYDQARARAEGTAAQIPFAQSPEEVARLYAIVSEETARGWQLLLQADEDLAKANQGQFLAFLADSERKAQERLEQLESDMRADSDAIRQDLGAHLDSLAAAGAQLAAASNNMAAAAASIPSRIVVESRVNVIVPELG